MTDVIEREDPERTTGERVVRVGDRWMNPRGRVYRVVRFGVGDARLKCVVVDEASGMEDGAYWPLMLAYWRLVERGERRGKA